MLLENTTVQKSMKRNIQASLQSSTPLTTVNTSLCFLLGKQNAYLYIPKGVLPHTVFKKSILLRRLTFSLLLQASQTCLSWWGGVVRSVGEDRISKSLAQVWGLAQGRYSVKNN